MHGGAARAALRLHQGLLAHGVETRMLVGRKESKLPTVLEHPAHKLSLLPPKVRRSVDIALSRLQRTPNANLHSPAYLDSGIANVVNASNADVVNLHWVGYDFMSVEEIGQIGKPLVWTLHDMWAFSGSEHYGPDDKYARWRTGYTMQNRPPDHKGIDIDRWVWRRKQRSWQRPLHIVTPSRWLAECVRNSELMGRWPVTVIPNLLDTRLFQPQPKEEARRQLGLPLDCRLILFGAIGGALDPRKGWGLLEQALLHVSRTCSRVRAIVVGQNEPINPPRSGIPMHWFDQVADDTKLALLYSAADVVVVPSLQENLPQAATEPQACGCPVVAFACTGMPDVVEHGTTGFLAEAFDPMALASGIMWLLEDDVRLRKISSNARERAVRQWAPTVVIGKYVSAYAAALEQERTTAASQCAEDIR